MDRSLKPWLNLVSVLQAMRTSFILFGILMGITAGLFLTLYFIIETTWLTMWGFTAISIVCKICYGAAFPLVNMLIDEVFGKANGPQVYGLLLFGLMAAALAGPNLIVIWFRGMFD